MGTRRRPEPQTRETTELSDLSFVMRNLVGPIGSDPERDAMLRKLWTSPGHDDVPENEDQEEDMTKAEFRRILRKVSRPREAPCAQEN